MVPPIALMPVVVAFNVQNSPIAVTVLHVFVERTVTLEVRYYLPGRGTSVMPARIGKTLFGSRHRRCR